MAFFTRVNTNVPFLLPEQCHAENSHIENDAEDMKCEIDDKIDCVDSQKKDDSGRYDYVVDRVLGVEV